MGCLSLHKPPTAQLVEHSTGKLEDVGSIPGLVCQTINTELPVVSFCIPALSHIATNRLIGVSLRWK